MYVLFVSYILSNNWQLAIIQGLVADIYTVHADVDWHSIETTLQKSCT